MKTYFYERANGDLIRMEAEQLFWNGSACIFVKNNATVGAIVLLPGEFICESSFGQEIVHEGTTNPQHKPS